jgi:hypothetical protein
MVNPPPSTTTFTYDTTAITEWFNSGGIMVYDIASTGDGNIDTSTDTDGLSNADIWLYFSTIYSLRNP